MGAIRLLKNEYTLRSELPYSASMLGRYDYLIDTLTSFGVHSVSEITNDTLALFQKKAKADFLFEANKYRAYRSLLEVSLYEYLKETSHVLYKEAAKPVYKKLAVFLFINNVSQATDISANLRQDYEEYLTLHLPETKVPEYIKAMDQMKLSSIKNLAIEREITYQDSLIYLGYYPAYSIASRFYYTANKHSLYFDFSLDAPKTLKKEIFLILKDVLSKADTMKNHYLIQHHLEPLNYLYHYCVEENITDIKYMLKPEIDGFYKYLDTNMQATNANAPQVLSRARRTLFILDKKPDFRSTAWFLSRFSFSEERVNPAREVTQFTFDDLLIKENREVFQNFMKYLLVLSPKYALQGIQQKYNMAKQFLYFLEKKQLLLSDVSASDIKNYITYLDRQYENATTYNKELACTCFFIENIRTREHMPIPLFDFDYYYKKSIYKHNDRSVSEDVIDTIFSVLPSFPETLGLMYLVLYSTGLRINEVCTLRRNCLSKDNGTFWLFVYQYKLKADKQIPIPEELYLLLKKRSENLPDETDYLFYSPTDVTKPYHAATFSVQMKKELKKYGITKDIDFRSHDYRHTIASDLYYSGATLQTTRAFLGHKREDMTKQYIDHLPGHIDKKQTEYFKENPL